MNREVPMALVAVLAVIAIASLAGCAAKPAMPGPPADVGREDLSKIKFDLEKIHPDGLRGPPDGLVSITYDFWVPADERIYQEVRRIDPGVQITPGATSGGGGGPGTAYCRSNTGKPRWREILGRLSALSYVKEIRECFFER